MDADQECRGVFCLDFPVCLCQSLGKRIGFEKSVCLPVAFGFCFAFGFSEQDSIDERISESLGFSVAISLSESLIFGFSIKESVGLGISEFFAEPERQSEFVTQPLGIQEPQRESLALGFCQPECFSVTFGQCIGLNLAFGIGEHQRLIWGAGAID